MAEGAARSLQPELAASRVTGIAGPDGGSERSRSGTLRAAVRRGHGPARVEHRASATTATATSGAAALARPPSSPLARGDGSREWCAAGERIHVIGIAGSGAAGVALLAAPRRRAGRRLRRRHAVALYAAARGGRHPHHRGHDPAHLAGVEPVAITPALRAVPDLPELAAARERGLPIVTWQALLGELMATRATSAWR